MSGPRLLLSLSYSPAISLLTVTVHSARDLPGKYMLLSRDSSIISSFCSPIPSILILTLTCVSR